VQEDEHPVLRLDGAARGVLVGEDLSFAVDDELAVHTHDRLDDVDVLTDDRGDVGIAGERARQPELERVRRGLELSPPMEVDDHDPGPP
jgi:hypothetical protein